MYGVMDMSGDMTMAHAVTPNSNTGHPLKATCADMCAAASAATAALPAASATVLLNVDMLVPRPLAPKSLASREPDRHDPPPKPCA